MTIAEWLRLGEARLLAGPHPERARQDAERLLMHAALFDRAALLTRLDEVLLEEEASIYGALVKRRATGEPIQYILGEAEFYGLRFKVGADVLIPRPETEHLVEKAIEVAKRFDGPRIVDVGTGSGAIAVALAHALPSARLTSIDASPRALDVARDNAKKNSVADRIIFVQGDLLAPIAGEQFDLICSNPPYVSERDRDTLAVEVREYEPSIALFAGEDGLDVIRRLIPAAYAALVPRGYLLMEIGHGQWAEVKALMEAAGFANLEAVADLQGIPRVACGEKS